MATKYKKTFENKLALNNKNLQKILSFYLFHCPVSGTSFRGIAFEKYGWKGAPQFATLKRELLKHATESLSANYFPSKKDELAANFAAVSTVTPVDEYCVFLRNEENTVMQSLFSAIRNAFAHGSFSIREYTFKGCKYRIYFFSNYKNYLKAEMVLHEKTLLSWISVVESGYRK